MFDHFEKEGTFFRRHSLIRGAPVDEIWTRLKCERCTGDRVKVVWYGDPIAEAELIAARRRLCSSIQECPPYAR